MFTIKTSLGNSKINGTGVFADEPLKKGEIIWKFVKHFDVKITDKQFKTLPKIAQEYILHFAYYSKKEGGYILCSDNAKFTNHSSTPNMKTLNKVNSIVTSDIKVGDEILEDYFYFDELASSKLSNKNS